VAALIDRVSADDLMSLAADDGIVPMQIGTILMLDTHAVDGTRRIMDALRDRVGRVPRLRQTLELLPPGQGRPIWVDDPTFSLDEHVRVATAGGGNARVLDVAADALTARLPRSRPLWSATIVPEVAPGRTALILVMHHVLADGVAGMHLIDGLMSPEVSARVDDFPRPRPTRAELRREALSGWGRSLTTIPASVRRLAGAVAQVRPGLAHRLGATSLDQPTGARRRIITVSCGLAELHTAAHAQRVTINDVLLAIVARSLARLLRTRGETIDEFTLSVPFSSPAAEGTANSSGVMLLRIPAVGSLSERLRATATLTRAAKLRPRAASTALLGPMFRMLGRLGLYRRFIESQRSIHSIVSNVHGPDRALEFAGIPVVDLIPLSVVAGNITVAFIAASYGGRFTVTVVADPDTCTDLDALAVLLQRELQAAIGATAEVR